MIFDRNYKKKDRDWLSLKDLIIKLDAFFYWKWKISFIIENRIFGSVMVSFVSLMEFSVIMEIFVLFVRMFLGYLNEDWIFILNVDISFVIIFDLVLCLVFMFFVFFVFYRNLLDI